MGVNGTAFAVLPAQGAPAAPTCSPSGCRATAWEAVPAPLDIDAARAAGAGTGRADVAVAAEGYAVAAWGEGGRVYGRRITGLALSLAPQRPPLRDLGGVPGQTRRPARRDDRVRRLVRLGRVPPGRPRAAAGARPPARRLAFDPPVALDAGPRAVTARGAQRQGRRHGVSVTGAGTLLDSALKSDAFQPAARLDVAGGAADPVVGTSERTDLVTWRGATAPACRALRVRGQGVGPADAAQPPRGGPGRRRRRLAEHRPARRRRIAARQGVALVAAVYDRPPGGPGSRHGRYQRRSLPLLRWQAGAELWGQQFKVLSTAWRSGDGRTRARSPTPLAQGATAGRSSRSTGAASRPPAAATIRIDSVAPRLRVRVDRPAAGCRRPARRAREPTPRGSGLKYAPSATATGAADAASRAAHRYRAGASRSASRRPTSAGNAARGRSACASADAAAGRPARVLELGGAPAADGDRQRDAGLLLGRRRPPRARGARARARAELRRGGRGVLDVGGESARRRPARRCRPRRSSRACVPLVERRRRRLDALVSVDTLQARVAEAAVAAGAAMVNDVSGLRDPGSPRCARAAGRGARGHAHARGAQGHAARPGRLRRRRRPTCGSSCAERMALARERGVAEEQLVLDPGPDFAKTPAQTVAVLRALDALHALGRPLLLAVSRKDFLGAITGRGPRERGAATLAALGRGRRRRRAPPARARRGRGGRLPRGAGRAARRAGARPATPTPSAPDRGPLPAGSLACRCTGCRPLRTTRPDAHRPTIRRSAHVLRARPLRARGEPARRPPPARQRARRRRLPPPAQARPDRRHPRQGRRGPESARRPARRRATPTRRRRRAADGRAPTPRPPRSRPPTPRRRRGARARRRGRRRRRSPRRAPPTRTPATAPAPQPRAAAAAAAAARRADWRRAREPAGPAAEAEDRTVEGVVELLGNGSALRPPHPARADRRRRLRLRRPGQALRARLGRPRRPAPCARRGAPSATRRSCASTPSTAAPPTRSPRAPASRTCRPRSRPSASTLGDGRPDGQGRSSG